jgi:hypothetical protein
MFGQLLARALSTERRHQPPLTPPPPPLRGGLTTSKGQHIILPLRSTYLRPRVQVVNDAVGQVHKVGSLVLLSHCTGSLTRTPLPLHGLLHRSRIVQHRRGLDRARVDFAELPTATPPQGPPPRRGRRWRGVGRGGTGGRLPRDEELQCGGSSTEAGGSNAWGSSGGTNREPGKRRGK